MPLVIGGRAAIITIMDDAPNSPQIISLSASVIAALTISPAAPGANSVTVTAGQTAVFNLQLTPGTGFAGSASFACAGAPTAAKCTAPNVQISGGMPITYMVNVTTTKNSLIVHPPNWPQLPPIIWLRVSSLTLGVGIFILLLYASRPRGVSDVERLLRTAALTLLASACLFEAAGCGGGANSAVPQSVPSLQVVGTPHGTSIITLMPSVVTSTGTPVSGISPVQLTLTVQ
jgi:hypothetical protein